MVRYAGIKNNRICIVSDSLFNSGMEILEIPQELSNISASELITNCIVRDGQIKCKHFKKPINKIKLALVGNWKMRCGIATYSENLWPEITKHVGDFNLFIEKNEVSTGDIHQIGDRILSDDKVIVCWKRGESLCALVKELKEYDPDIILIQHEFGLWPNASYWLAMMNQLSDYRVIVTMHSVFHHRDKTIVEAVIPEIVTHLEGGRLILKKEKGIFGKVHVIPHGCYTFNNERLWNFYKSEKTFMQQGFGFEYKNFEASIKATAILKEKYSDIFFTALISESTYNITGHAVYFRKLMDLVDKFSLQENVAIIRGYRSDTVIDSFLLTNQAAVFPYISIPGHEVYGASGAARMAMSRGIATITSSIPHFSDLPTIKADTPEEIAAALERLFIEPGTKEKQIELQTSYLNDNTWEKVGLRYISLFENEINDKKRHDL